MMNPIMSEVDLDRFLERDDLENLATRPGPWMTVYLPRYAPGANVPSPAARLKHLRHAAADLLASHKVFRDVDAEKMREPLDHLDAKPFADEGGDAHVLFTSPASFEVFRLRENVEEILVAGQKPFVKPLLNALNAPFDFYVLELGKKHLRLMHCTRDACEEVALPPGVPSSLQAAMGFDQPDHTLANRSASGVSNGGMRGVRFGTASDYEAHPDHLAHYFAMIDRGVRKVLRGAPLLLAGVAEEIAAYRRISHCANLLDAEIVGNAGLLQTSQLNELARAAAREQVRHQAWATLREYHETPERHRTMHNAEDILLAASIGRVHCLLCAENQTMPATHNARRRPALLEGEDLMNAAAVETIANGGQVYMLPLEDMGDAGPMAAILRY